MMCGKTTVQSYEFGVTSTTDSLSGRTMTEGHPDGGRERRMDKQLDNGKVSGEDNGMATE
jgi:hypothetical protein